eukprot:maker-scaffold_1-snap-gene-25.1-mRNA-1 protein AED:0.30 eAED:0.30 QI:93/0/0/1/1/1/2/0/448
MMQSSLSVFESFVEYKDGVCDAQRILSKECFQLWVNSRQMYPKKPEESFRKAVTSHCGVDGRRPFSKDVEASLLKHLRKKVVWPCFEDHKYKIGRRGFKTLGYWEKRMTESLDDAHTKSSVEQTTQNYSLVEFKEKRSRNRVGSKKKRALKDISESLVAYDIPPHLSQVYRDNLTQSKYDVKASFLPTEFLLQQAARLSPRALKEVPQMSPFLKEEQDKVLRSMLYEFGNFYENKVVPNEQENNSQLSDYSYNEDVQNLTNQVIASFIALGRLGSRRAQLAVQTCLNFIPQKYLSDFAMGLYNQSGIESIDSSTGKVSEKMRFFFSKEFNLPSKPFRTFDPLKPVGRILGDQARFTVVDMDETAKKSYRGNIHGVHSLAIRVHKTQAVAFFKEMIETYKREGEVWTRSIEYRCDGTIMVLLNRHTSLPSSLLNSLEFQDVTAEYAHLL